MPTTNIEVNKQSVIELLTSGQTTPFVIPEYQRPYSWNDEDQITTLFEDLWEFYLEKKQSGDESKTYFLGCIVSYEENNERQIIDGQQRLTSLFLFLRAIYAQLEKEEVQRDEVVNFRQQIEKALWKANKLTGKVDKSQILLRSNVVTEDGNDILRHILETGECDPKASDNYSKNYRRFLKLYTEKANGNYMSIYEFILSVLSYSILLPITADSQETALTIFNTLNNRGLPLSDADIFKSYIYKKLNDDEKKVFIDKWKKLEKDASDIKESIQSLFYYNMFYLRALNKDEKTSTPGIRNYYLDKNENRLTADVIDTLAENLVLWTVIKGRQEIENVEWSKNLEIRKILDCLSSYPNEFWKYPVSIFYMEHKDCEEFEVMFLKFLRKLFVLLLTRYLETPTISAIRGDILKLDKNIIGNIHPEFNAGFDIKQYETEEEQRLETTRIKNMLISPHKKTVTMLLELLAYQDDNQTDLLPASWEIEHIFPQKFDNIYFKFNEEEAKELLEHIGNKIPLEKKLNISASNGYYSKKKDKYLLSNIALAKKMGASNENEWGLDEIRKNDYMISQEIMSILNAWVKDYDYNELDKAAENIPTAEEAEWLEKLRNRGLI